MNDELYNSICKAKIEESIFLVTKILLKDIDKNIDIIINTFIAVCSYIASFITIFDIKLWIDVINNLISFINDENVVIKDIYVLITKMCILCDIYIKNPVIKTGTINIKVLRTKIIDMFENDKFKLSTNGTTKFEGLLPPPDSEAYNLSIQIITGVVYIIKQIESLQDYNLINDLANKLRQSFDYIIRKKYTFETKFYESDNDAVWFLWGIVSILSNENDLDMIYQLFNYEYTKKNKSYRVGFLWGAALLVVYFKKKNISREWNTKELKVIQKIDEISLILYNDIKKQLVKNCEIEIQKPENSTVDGIDYISQYKPYENNDNILPEKITNANEPIPVKSIKYKKEYMY